ncbi:NAD-dependent succinate-semialdehyde dehydrogenase [Rhizobium brockwellii]|uniref:NAD-dependent succinate-semialdehyde dehydrogenase n=1 Tax=Rhizobium brockwellii TaxID=3019932 RepID=A0ABU3YKV1_9HYPH|nr:MULTISPECIES: NAD-dependent succinate-semialdehyde dehydrogenase [Rhizobium]MDV4179204.1 NAD-dependent succinate-semialdehyde dehydrogenase [Rhizobium brockwellii]MDV4186486.1 NAD-dependent succinate-semialdehyde dehydrogenase [Rhizobium brockwellii]
MPIDFQRTDEMTDKQQCTYPKIGLLIDGEWIYDREALCDVENPSDESILGQVPKATARDLQNALESSARGFETWRRTPPTARAAVMRRAAALVRERAKDIAPIFTAESGRTYAEVLAEIERSATFLDWDSEEIRRLYGRIVPTDPPIQQFVVREPVGPVAAFTPWNVPMSAPSRKISASLAAGCSIILKPAEETPATACLFAQCFLDAGLPKGVLNVVFGDPDEVSRTLVLSPITRLVTLTGSINVGKHLTRLAVETMKPVLMELGGHAPVIIDENTNADEIAQLAVNWKFRMAGQFCSAPSRFLIHRSRYDDFVSSISEKASKLKVGDGFTEGVQMGPLANRRRLAAMADLVEDAVSHGARVTTGGKRVGNRGWFYEPTVLADVPLDARVMSEEPFGPIAPCMAVDSMDEALKISNSLSMGLAAFVFTNDMERADYLSRELQVGSVALNVFTSPGGDAPFGGVRESGIGREGGTEMYHSYTVAKTIAERRVKV